MDIAKVLGELFHYEDFKMLKSEGKINVDNKARFRYLDSYWFRLIP
jgi:hypothetical protein